MRYVLSLMMVWMAACAAEVGVPVDEGSGVYDGPAYDDEVQSTSQALTWSGTWTGLGTQYKTYEGLRCFSSMYTGGLPLYEPCVATPESAARCKHDGGWLGIWDFSIRGVVNGSNTWVTNEFTINGNHVTDTITFPWTQGPVVEGNYTIIRTYTFTGLHNGTCKLRRHNSTLAYSVIYQGT